MADPLPQTVDDIIVDGLVGWLTQRLQAPFDDDEPTKVNLIRAGKLQDDPTREGLNFTIHDSSESEKWTELYGGTGADGFYAPMYEVGGGSTHKRAFTIQMDLHFKGVTDRILARRYAHIVFQRTRLAIAMMNPRLHTLHPYTNQPQDDFYETITHPPQIAKGTLREGGGRGHFIWRGEIIVEFFTELFPPDEP